jgi:hypothetical protein
MHPEGSFCQSCGMPLHKPEDHGTEANGSQSKKYCAYCYQTGEFREPEMTLDEMIEISAKGWSDQDPDVSLEQARTQMKQILPHLERWRALAPLSQTPSHPHPRSQERPTHQLRRARMHVAKLHLFVNSPPSERGYASGLLRHTKAKRGNRH